MSLPLIPHTPEQTQTTTQFLKFSPSNMSSYQVIILGFHVAAHQVRVIQPITPGYQPKIPCPIPCPIELHSPDALYFSVFLYMTPTPTSNYAPHADLEKRNDPPPGRIPYLPLAQRYIFMIHCINCRRFRLHVRTDNATHRGEHPSA
jgi:hypothetical protein